MLTIRLNHTDDRWVRLLLPTGEEVRVTLVDSGLGFAKFGVEAPRSVLVHRQKLLERMAAEGAETKSPNPNPVSPEGESHG